MMATAAGLLAGNGHHARRERSSWVTGTVIMATG
jgi:hypothetical protein